MIQSKFYDSLSAIEQEYWHRLAELFQLVNPQKPEKGIETLILRARKLSAEKQTPLAYELEIVFKGAQERTHRRVELLNACSLPKASNAGPIVPS